jgi:hypothetical protein
MVSKHRIAEYVKNHMESVKWREGDSGGFVGRINDAMVHIAGSDLSRVILTVSADNEQYVIGEPQPMQDAPIGKWIEWSKVNILRREPTKIEPELQAAIELKQTLCEIVKYASSQCLRRYQDPQWDRKLRSRIWSKLTGEFE